MKYLSILLFIMLNILTGCGPSKKMEHPVEKIPAPLEAALPPAPRYWTSEESFGNKISVVDYSGTTLWKDDARIHAMHHKNLREELGDNYVLWRMKHDGSCWLSAATTLLIYQMIEAGPARFDEIVAHFKKLVSDHGQIPKGRGEFFVDEFFDVFTLIRSKMDHRFSLDVRNHQNIYNTLDDGMRMLLAAYARSGGLTYLSISDIEKPKSWGMPDCFRALFVDVDLENPFIDIVYSDEGEVSTGLQGSSDPHPKMLILFSSPAYIDVLVEKQLSDRINS